MRPRPRLALAVAALAVAAARAPAQVALRQLVPDDALAVVEVVDPPQALRALRSAVGAIPPDLPLRAKVPLALGLVGVFAAVGADPERWAQRMAGGGAVFAWLPAPGGVRAVAVLRPGAPQAARQWLRAHARGVEAVAAGDVLVLAADATLAADLAARANAPAGRYAQLDLGPAAAVRGVVDVAALRVRAPLPPTADAGQHVLFAPLAHAYRHATWLRVALDGGERLAARVHADASLRASPARTLFADAAAGRVLPVAADALLVLRLDRSLRRVLAAPEQHLPPDGVRAVQGFLTIADALVGARASFVDDVLGNLGEPFELHVLPIGGGGGDGEDDDRVPAIRLPGIALVAPLVRPAAEPVLFRAGQLLLLLANAERARRGRPLFTARLHHTAAGRGLVAEPVPWRGPSAPPLEQGLSPTLWCEAGVAVLASTRAAATAIVERARAGAVPPGSPPAHRGGDLLLLRGPELARALAANRRVVELGRMLDEGESRADAARFVDVVLAVLRAVHEVAVHVDCDDASTTVELTVERAR